MKCLQRMFGLFSTAKRASDVVQETVEWHIVTGVDLSKIFEEIKILGG